MKYIKTFEELSPELMNRATRSAERGAFGDTSKEHDPLYQNKAKQQYNKFSSYVNPEIKEKLNSMGFGYRSSDETHYIMWSPNRIDEKTTEAQLALLINPTSYQVVKGDVNSIPSEINRKLLRAVAYLQEKLKLPNVSSPSLLDADNDIDTVGKCANCGVEYHIHKSND